MVLEMLLSHVGSLLILIVAIIIIKLSTFVLLSPLFFGRLTLAFEVHVASRSARDTRGIESIFVDRV
jgi:hypothetical protein